MCKETVELADLDEAIDDNRFKPRIVQVYAVRAEKREQAKPRRDISQEGIAKIFSVSPHNLRKWVTWYDEEGV